jgi:hypothetical protein
MVAVVAVTLALLMADMPMAYAVTHHHHHDQHQQQRQTSQGMEVARQAAEPAWLSDIVMGGPASLTYLYGPEYVEVEVQMVRGIELAFAAANARVGYDRLGVLARRNITARFEDDQSDTARTRNITLDLLALPEDEFFGFLVGPDAECSQGTHYPSLSSWFVSACVSAFDRSCSVTGRITLRSGSSKM